MARENQGLQIALIIFVMLTIVLGVTTFIFFRRYDETMADLKKKTEESASTSRDLATEKSQKVEYVKFMGFNESDKQGTIEEEFRKDMTENTPPEFPEENRSYRQVVKYQANQIAELNKLREAQKIENAELKAYNEARDGQVKPKVDVAQAGMEKASVDLTDERGKFNADRERFKAQEASLAAKLENARKTSEAEVAKLQSSLERNNVEMQKLINLVQERGEKIDDLVKETFEVADGEITWVNQREGTVWVNLGRADGLARQTSFAVYAADTNDVTKAGKKGSIEITQVLGDHVSEARIVEDRVTDPLMTGDKINTPIWSPGERRSFALAGKLDVDADGKSDLRMILNLVSLNGGVVDCYQDDKTWTVLTGDGKPGGRMNPNTRFLVVGEAPEGANLPKEALTEYSKMIGEAKKLGIKTIPLKELLAQMGWRESTRVVTFGPGGNPSDFKPLPREGRASSSGDVSDLFRERNPPNKPAPRSAF